MREGTEEEREGNGQEGKRGGEGRERGGRDIPIPDWESEKVATVHGEAVKNKKKNVNPNYASDIRRPYFVQGRN